MSPSNSEFSSPTKYSSSALQTPPEVTYPNLVAPFHTSARALRREASEIIDNDCHRVLTKTFGHSGWKGQQKEVVQAAVRGADVFVLAPTGMGKSLCFQVPAVAEKHGITIVVSPLLALMSNQVTSLRQKAISVSAFTSETGRTEKQEIMKELASGHPHTRLLYITPEKLCTSEFMKLLIVVYKAGELNRLVVDEAHCISEWGHDFRGDYRNLGNFRNRFPDVPIMALTATATPAVQLDIIRTLRMSEKHLFKVVHPFNRANLFYEVRYTSAPKPESQMAGIQEYISTLHRRRKRPSSGIIYCRNRLTCDDLSNYLRSKGLNSRPYHRGISPKVLNKTLKDWQVGGTGDGGVDVVCATIAFGMGIDKSDVRYIIHYDLPKSFEGYYQETGRAGRDGSPAKCILYYSREDAISVKRWVEYIHSKRTYVADTDDGQSPGQRALHSLNMLVKFAESTEICRHVSICRYFGEPIDTDDTDIVKRYCNSMCDICKYHDKTRRRKTMLSSLEYAGTQVDTTSIQHDEDDEDEEELHRVPDLAQNVMLNQFTTASTSGSVEWKKNFPHGGSSTITASSYGKRPNSMSSNNEHGSNKRPKVSYAPALVTKPFSSVSSLSKPFKTPFKTPFKVPPPPPPPPIRSRSRSDSPEVQIVEENILIQPSVQEEDRFSPPPFVPFERPSPPSSPVEFPDMGDMDQEAYLSHKIPTDLRHTGLRTIRGALQKVFVNGISADDIWRDRIRGAPSDIDERNDVLATTARSMENLCHSMCTTSKGYNERVKGAAEAVKLISGLTLINEQSDDMEDAVEVVEAITEVCRQRRKKGKARAG